MGFTERKRRQWSVYRCTVCRGMYNLYSGTVVAGRYFRPEQMVLFLCGVLQGKATVQLAL